ncbi:Secreted RxLR effector peptide protein [Phytophthora palmivora]|uniref:RxLR effector protein n=1 Tax=Phytophthora palmivora TaxID=4796 RepID=A0A2P4XDQ6_9STRA|nr:Secreted RxLR effector peptide protein [Phytophthora palmivora]
MMRVCILLFLVAITLFGACHASEVNLDTDKRIPERMSVDAIRSDPSVAKETNKRLLRAHPDEDEERSPKTLKSAVERVQEWLRKEKGLEGVKSSLMVSSLTQNSDPKKLLYKQFGNALLKSQEPKNLYKKWRKPTKWDKIRGCFGPPCVEPQVLYR